jgi:phytoene desaturase
MSKKIVVIGSGFSGLAAAAMLAKQGNKVTVLEKNEQPGGRARIWQKDGFVFDMGPSWYWMPEVFEQFYNQFGKKTSDFYALKRLNPSYRIFFDGNEIMDVPASMKELEKLFEEKEKGSAAKLREFLNDAKYKYETAMSDYVHRISDSLFEFLDFKLIIKSFQIQLFTSLRTEVRKRFKHPHLIQLLEFPVLFLGSTPDKTPALYSMMNYADLSLGTWYPMGGMNKIVEAFVKICEQLNVEIRCNEEVKQILVLENKARKVITQNNVFEADAVVAGSDYEHTEQNLLSEENRQYDSNYWDNRVMSPSSLLFYVGVNKTIPNLLHHNLFFDADFDQHAKEIYEQPMWPQNPLFYVCCPSKTDGSVAPIGSENLFILMPLAPGIEDSEAIREKYFNVFVERLEQRTGEPFKQNIVLKRSYAISDFKKDYHSFKGNAYGLANTLLQTAFLKPKMKSKKVKNLLFTGQLTVPGPGVPPSIISGQMAANEIGKMIAAKTI